VTAPEPARPDAIGGPVVVEVDVAPVSINALTHEHWRTRHHRRRRERRAVARALEGKRVPPFPLRVTFVRLAPGTLDEDNLSSAFKTPRDEVTAWLGLRNDRDPRVQWRYAQEKARVVRPRGLSRPSGRKFRVWMRIEIAPLEDTP
jgi:hypothetical protein